MSSIHDQIKEVVTTHRVVLFMKGTKQFPQCGFSSVPYKSSMRQVAPTM